MNSTPDYELLARQVERVIHEHLAASRKAVEGAVLRAFGLSARSAGRPGIPASSPVPRKLSPRRSPEELATLRERFAEAVRLKPGETMAVLAKQLGVAAGELHLPMSQLKQGGQLRSVGLRHLTRYFPVVPRPN